MRKYTILLAAAPLALLAACADDADTDADMAEDTAADTTAIDTADTDQTMADDDYTPGPATALADAGDISGGYTYTAEDGKTRAVKIESEGKKYTYFGPDGIQYVGEYSWTNDGFRLLLPDFDGSQTWFAVREGSLIRMGEDTELTADTTVEGERYRRDDDNAMFTREPYIGSPVAPQD